MAGSGLCSCVLPHFVELLKRQLVVSNDVTCRMPSSEFSERLFEFSVTREIMDRMNARLVGSPSLPAIPSQRLEKKLAYDVSVQQKSGRSLFLQFKTARYQTTARAKDWTTAGSKPHFST